MAWVPIEGALRKLREARDLSRQELADRSGVRHRTIRAHESGTPPRTMQDDTIRLLAKALNVDKSALAKKVADSELAHAIDVNAGDQRMLPAVKTLTLRAEQERGLGVHDGVMTRAGRVEVLGPALMQRLSAGCALHEGQRFAVVGTVRQYDAIPQVAAKVLGVPLGFGARVMLLRKLVKGSPFYATVFTRTGEQTKTIFDCEDGRKKVTAIVRVIVKPPAQKWKGFFVFEKRPKPHPFALLVDEILTEDISPACKSQEKPPTNLAEHASA